MDLVKDKTSIQRDFVSIQYPEKHGNLTDFKINMKSLKFGQYPSSTKGSITAFWVHDQACVPAYGIRLCDEVKCDKTVRTSGKLGEKMKINLELISENTNKRGG